MKKRLWTVPAAVVMVLVFAACGKDNDKEDIAAKIEEAVSDKSDGSVTQNEADKAQQPEAARDSVNEQVDKEWIGVLEANGTMYDAFYSLPAIMKEEKPDHPDDVIMPEGLSEADYSYYDSDPENTEYAKADMYEVAGTWIPVSTKFMDVETDYTWARDAGVDFHLILNEDGSGSCNMYGEEQKVPWNSRTITMQGNMECTYHLDGDNLILANMIADGQEMSWVFERDVKSNTFARAHEDDETKYLGRKLEGAKLYRLTGIYQGGVKKEDNDDDASLDPETHFVVMVETDENSHSGYGYMRDGAGDTALYYQGDRGIVKLINEDTKDRSGGMGRTKFEIEGGGKTLRLWPEYQRASDKYNEYELCEDEEAPVCHLAVGPNPDRSFEIPEGSRNNAGFWRLDRIPGYMYYYNDPLMSEDDASASSQFVYGTQTRKYDADIWYVLNDDGTGYMRVWDRYFEVVWSDDEQYCYDISGRHKLGSVVGEIDYDGMFVRMFRDEINDVPGYPDELK